MLPVIKQCLALKTGVAPSSLVQAIEARLLGRLSGVRHIQQTRPATTSICSLFRLRGRYEALAPLLPVLACPVAFLFGRCSRTIGSVGCC